MKFNLEEAIKQSTLEDGKLDYAKLKGIIDNDYVNPIVASKKPDLDKVKEEAKTEWIKDLGFEGVDSEAKLKAYVKGTSDEWKEKYTTLEGKFKELDTKYNDVNGKYTDINSKYINLNRVEQLRKDNFNGDVEYALYKINQMVSDDKDYETAYNEYKESNKPSFAPNKVPTMGAKIVAKDGSVKYGFERVLEEQGKL